MDSHRIWNAEIPDGVCGWMGGWADGRIGILELCRFELVAACQQPEKHTSCKLQQLHPQPQSI